MDLLVKRVGGVWIKRCQEEADGGRDDTYVHPTLLQTKMRLLPDQNNQRERMCGGEGGWKGMMLRQADVFSFPPLPLTCTFRRLLGRSKKKNVVAVTSEPRQTDRANSPWKRHVGSVSSKWLWQRFTDDRRCVHALHLLHSETTLRSFISNFTRRRETLCMI